MALSLHAATDAKRLPMMAVTKTNPLADVMDALMVFYKTTRTKITFEYVMLKGVNDTDQDAADLIKLSRKIPSFVNLIEFNVVDKVKYEKSSTERIQEFANMLIAGGVNARIRMSRGEDIDAACGQLANKL